MAEHIKDGYEIIGVSKKEAERRAWARVHKNSGGGKKENKGPVKKGGRQGDAARKNNQCLL